MRFFPSPFFCSFLSPFLYSSLPPQKSINTSPPFIFPPSLSSPFFSSLLFFQEFESIQKRMDTVLEDLCRHFDEEKYESVLKGYHLLGRHKYYFLSLSLFCFVFCLFIDPLPPPFPVTLPPPLSPSLSFLPLVAVL